MNLLHVLVGSLHVFLHVGMVAEIGSRLRQDFVYLGIQDRILVRAGHDHEDARPQYIIIISRDETRHQAVVLSRQLCALPVQLTQDFIVIHAIHDHLALLVGQFCQARIELNFLEDERVEAVVEGSSSGGLVHFVEFHLHLTRLQHKGHHALVPQEEVGHHDGIHNALEREAPMNDLRRVYRAHVVILEHFQIQGLTFQIPNRG